MFGKHEPHMCTGLRIVLDSLVVLRAVIAEDVGHRSEGERLVTLKHERDTVERILCDVLGGSREVAEYFMLGDVVIQLSHLYIIARRFAPVSSVDDHIPFCSTF
jgi:hypothetical protein